MNDQELDCLLDEWRAPASSPALRRQLIAAFPASGRWRIFGLPARWVFAGALGTAVAALAAAAFTAGPIADCCEFGSADTPSGTIYARFMGSVEPPIAAIQWRFKSGGVSFGHTQAGVSGSSWSASDRHAGPFYGLEFTADRLPDGSYMVHVASLSLARLQRGPMVRNGPIVPLPTPPPVFKVAEGHSFEVDVYRSGSTRVSTRVSLSATPFPGMPQPPMPMHLEGARLLRNGVELGAWPAKISAETLWFRLPGQGRYVLALEPAGNSNFVQAGSVNGAALEVHDGGDVYRLESKSPIAAGGARPIYLWHDPAFETHIKPHDQSIFPGGAGKPCVFQGTCPAQ